MIKTIPRNLTLRIFFLLKKRTADLADLRESEKSAKIHVIRGQNDYPTAGGSKRK